jgi:hypothetical protein
LRNPLQATLWEANISHALLRISTAWKNFTVCKICNSKKVNWFHCWVFLYSKLSNDKGVSCVSA